MNILVLSHMFPNPCNPTSGVFVLEQMRALRHLGVKTTVIAPTPWAPRMLRFLRRVRKFSAMPPGTCLDGFSVEHPAVVYLPGWVFFSISGLAYYLRCRSLVRRYLKGNSIDLIHAHTIVPDGFAAALLGREFKVPVICTVHGSDISIYPKRSRATRLATRWSLSRIRNVIAVSHDLKQKIEMLTQTRQVEVVHNGADPNLFKPILQTEARRRLKLPLEDKMVLFVGNLVPVKGLEFLLDAFARLNRRDASLHLVGDGTIKARLVSMAKCLGLGDTCIFVGQRPHEEIPLWLSAADCLVLSSVSEGLPTILPEAMMCRVPIVATAVGGIPEIVNHNRTGLLVPPRDSLALSQAIAIILNMRATCLSGMLERAEVLAKGMFSWEANAHRTMAVYERAVERSLQAI